MDEQNKTIKSIMSRGRGTGRVLAVFFLGLVVVVLICLWTASHNIPLMTNGTDEVFRVFGGVAAVTGEVVVLWTYLLLFGTGGTQWYMVLGTHVAQLLILIVNSMVRYIQLTAHEPLIDQIINFYGSYIAPVPVLICAIAGALVIVHFDPNLAKRHADHNERAKAQKREVAMREWVGDQMDSIMESKEVQDELKAAAISAAIDTAKSVAMDYRGQHKVAKQTTPVETTEPSGNGKGRGNGARPLS